MLNLNPYKTPVATQPSSQRFSWIAGSNYRYVVLIATMLLAINMYVDRVAVGQLKGDIQKDLGWQGLEMSFFVGAFFFSYALGQVPGAALGLRIGFRNTLALLLVAWSISTIATGFAMGFVTMIAARIALGITEAGAYPNASALIRGWFPVSLRGRANSVVTLGGRMGWAIAQILTPMLLLWLGGWRAVLILYGAIGVVIAVPFFYFAKDHDVAEHDSIEPNSPAESNLSLIQLTTEPSLVCASVVQFMINFGWVFLLYEMPTYLEQVMKVDKIQNGFLSSIPAWISCIGMIFGGVVTDLLSKRFGLRFARSIPIASMMMLCAASYLICTQITSPLLFVGVISVMAIGVDFANPSIWAYAQDVGKRNAGKVLGWGNMWGNFGAGLGPIVSALIQTRYGWNTCFVVNAICFGIAFIAAFGMNASKPILNTRP